MNRNNDNYDDDDDNNNKSNNFISVQNRVKSLLNSEGRENWRKIGHAPVGTSLIMINTHYTVGKVFVNSSNTRYRSSSSFYIISAQSCVYCIFNKVKNMKTDSFTLGNQNAIRLHLKENSDDSCGSKN